MRIIVFVGFLNGVEIKKNSLCKIFNGIFNTLNGIIRYLNKCLYLNGTVKINQSYDQ